MISLFALAAGVVRHRRVVGEFARHELKRRYVGTVIGPLWALIHPAATIAIFWFVFEMGLKISIPSGVPFFYYFVTGIIPWFLFFETLSSGVNAVTDNRHLITKVVFPAEILPVVGFIAASLSHALLVVVIVVMLQLKGLFTPRSAAWVIYYYLALMVLAVGLSCALAALRVFLRDIGQAVVLALSLFFWLTPIIWTPEILPAGFGWVVDWNPVAYIVNGYRGALMGGVGPLDDPGALMRFWLVTVLLALGGAAVFRRLRSQFADML